MRARSSAETSPTCSSAVDEEAQPGLGGQAAGAGVRGVDQPRRLQVRHHVADRGGRERHRQDARQVARAHRLARGEVALHDAPEDLARAIVDIHQRAAPAPVPADRPASSCLVPPMDGALRAVFLSVVTDVRGIKGAVALRRSAKASGPRSLSLEGEGARRAVGVGGPPPAPAPAPPIGRPAAGHLRLGGEGNRAVMPPRQNPSALGKRPCGCYLPPHDDAPHRQHPQLLHRRPYRPRQVDAGRPADPGDRRAGRARDDGAGARLDGHRARARHHHQGADRAPRLQGARTARPTSST